LHLLRGRRLAERGPSAIGAVAEPDADNYDGLRAGEATVLELTESIGTTQQNVSKHLGVLQRCGIVARRKQGNFAYYRIVDEACSSSAKRSAAASSSASSLCASTSERRCRLIDDR
jgi:DNA-binding transcriptional ArsR family regulator